jgi:hypothetical protein
MAQPSFEVTNRSVKDDNLNLLFNKIIRDAVFPKMGARKQKYFETACFELRRAVRTDDLTIIVTRDHALHSD